MRLGPDFKAGLLPTALAAAALALPKAAAAEAWSRTYVVDWIEPAFYHGGAKGVNSPGTDCPAGTNGAVDFKTVLKTPWRTQEKVDYYLNPEHREELKKILRYRGPAMENVWEQPWLAPDRGMTPVTGDLSYGFDLDGNTKTGGFKGLDGRRGVDNAYYRVAGCWLGYRGEAFESHRGIYSNDGMADGRYTVVVVLSGRADPRNDPDARFGVYLSKDKLVKAASSGVASDYTFRIDPDPRFQTVAKVRIKDGVVETTAPIEIRMRDETWHNSIPQELHLYRGRMRFEMKPDGGLLGLVGGYRDWMTLYKREARDGRNTEMVLNLELPSYYYALQRGADAMPDPKTGRNTAISTAYRIRAVPAFVATPDAKAAVTVAQVFPPEAPAAAGAGN